MPTSHLRFALCCLAVIAAYGLGLLLLAFAFTKIGQNEPEGVCLLGVRLVIVALGYLILYEMMKVVIGLCMMCLRRFLRTSDDRAIGLHTQNRNTDAISQHPSQEGQICTPVPPSGTACHESSQVAT